MSSIIGLKKTTLGGDKPVFQTVLETAQGGFTLDRDDLTAAGTVVPAGTLVAYNETTRLAKVDSTVDNTNCRGLLYFPITVPAADEPDVDVAVVIRGTVYENRIPAIASNEKAALPTIIFSQSY